MEAHLAIDGTGALFGGAAVVLQSYVAAALRLRHVERLTVFLSPRSLRQFQLPQSRRLREVEVGRFFQSSSGRVAWLLGGLPNAVERAGASALICLGGGGLPPKGIRSATLIQQSLPFSREALERCPARTRVRMAAIKEMMRASANRCDLTIVQTQVMSHWIRENLRIPQNRIRICPPPIPTFPVSSEGGGLLEAMRATPADRRLLYVGNNSPYKNLSTLANALASVRQALPGTLLFATIDKTDALAREPGIVPLGPVNRSVLREAYQLATALILPSLVETVGLPLLEAMSLGVAVLAADRPYAHEVCGAGAAFFDPLDLTDVAKKAIEVLSNPARKAELVRAGQAEVAARSQAPSIEAIISSVA